MINHQRGGFPPPTTNMVFVKGEAEFDNYQITPGYTLWAKDLDAPVIYIKTIDIAGMTKKTILDCKERQSNNNQSNYVTKDDFEALKQEIRTLLIPPAPKPKAAKAGEQDA